MDGRHAAVRLVAHSQSMGGLPRRSDVHHFWWDSDPHWRRPCGHGRLPHHRCNITIQELHAARVRETPVSKLRVSAFTVSADGFGAGPDQGRDQPLGRGGEELHQWFFQPAPSSGKSRGEMAGRPVSTTTSQHARSRISAPGSWAAICSGRCAGRGRTMSGRVGGAPIRLTMRRSRPHAPSAPAAGDGRRHRLSFRHRGDRGGA